MEGQKQIKTVEELLSLEETGNYLLMNDIDLEGHEGTLIKKFYGVFDGQGYTIKNYNIATEYSGLFGKLLGNKAKVCNLNVENATISYGQKSGILVGRAAEGAIIENCIVRNSKIDGNDCSLICGNLNELFSKEEAEKVYVRNCRMENCHIGSHSIALCHRVQDAVIENCVVDNCTFECYRECFCGYTFHSTVSNCKVINSKFTNVYTCSLTGSTRDTEIIDSEVVMPPVKDKVISKDVLESEQCYEELKDKEELSFWGLYIDEPVDFPEVITKFTNVKKLNLGNNAWKSIPDSLLNLKNLEELQLDSAMSYIDKLPDLSQLPNLKILRANGRSFLTKHPVPSISLLPQLLKATQVEVLNISYWGHKYKETKLVRDVPESHVYDNLRNFDNLKMLILKDNSLTTLPKSLENHTLEYIDLSYNRISEQRCAMLASKYPNTVFNFEKNEDVENPIRQYPIFEYGLRILRSSSTDVLLDICNVFQSVINKAELEKSTDQYAIQFAHFGRLKSLSRLFNYDVYGSESNDEERRQLMSWAAENIEMVLTTPAPADSYWSFLQDDIVELSGKVTTKCYLKYSTGHPELAIELMKQIVKLSKSENKLMMYNALYRMLVQNGYKQESKELFETIQKEYPHFTNEKSFINDNQFNIWFKQTEFI